MKKNSLKLSLWLLLAAVSIQLPTVVGAEDKKTQRMGPRKKYRAARALYEKRKKEGAPKAELTKLENDIKKARRRWIGAIVGITAATVAVAGAAAYAAKKPGEAQAVDPDILKLIETIKINIAGEDVDELAISTAIFRVKGKRIDINTQDTQGMTPLHHAALVGNLRAIELLIQTGANVNAIDKQGKTVLDYQTAKGRYPNSAIVQLLIHKGAKLSSK
jgi:hypothetical protein